MSERVEQGERGVVSGAVERAWEMDKEAKTASKTVLTACVVQRRSDEGTRLVLRRKRDAHLRMADRRSSPSLSTLDTR